MDRFKFRVFCKSRGDYVEKMLDLTIYYDGRLVEYDGLEQDMDNHIIEQCTGLKDNNGNLIYEGDILRTYDEDWVIVEWADCGFKALIDDTYYDLDDIVDKYTQIISNIHEQKEN